MKPVISGIEDTCSRKAHLGHAVELNPVGDGPVDFGEVHVDPSHASAGDDAIASGSGRLIEFVTDAEATEFCATECAVLQGQPTGERHSIDGSHTVREREQRFQVGTQRIEGIQGIGIGIIDGTGEQNRAAIDGDGMRCVVRFTQEPYSRFRGNRRVVVLAVGPDERDVRQCGIGILCFRNR